MIIFLEVSLLLPSFLLFAFYALVVVVDVDHFLNHFFKQRFLPLGSFLAALGFEAGKTNYFVSHTFTMLSYKLSKFSLFCISLSFLGFMVSKDVRKCGWLDSFHFLSAILAANKLSHPSQTPSDGRVEVVLDGIISPSRQGFSNNGPSISMQPM